MCTKWSPVRIAYRQSVRPPTNGLVVQSPPVNRYCSVEKLKVCVTCREFDLHRDQEYNALVILYNNWHCVFVIIHINSSPNYIWWNPYIFNESKACSDDMLLLSYNDWWYESSLFARMYKFLADLWHTHNCYVMKQLI